jgi:hypothetical protein
MLEKLAIPPPQLGQNYKFLLLAANNKTVCALNTLGARGALVCTYNKPISIIHNKMFMCCERVRQKKSTATAAVAALAAAAAATEININLGTIHDKFRRHHYVNSLQSD